MDFNNLIVQRDFISNEILLCNKKKAELKEKYKNKINEKKNKVKNIIERIDQKFLSISIEQALISLPNRAVGSKNFSKILNEKSSQYDNSQFNKIIRFLTFVENTEDNYNSFYGKVKSNYERNPEKSLMQELVNLNRIINYEYSLMKILCSQIDKNKVEFNKIFNAIEDRGIFLTSSEKYQNSILGKISGGLEEIAQKIDLTNEYLNDISFQLWEIDGNITNSISSIISQLDSVESSIQAGNALNAVQNYQLYKINKNIKGSK
jgi:hypothetical protein